MYYGPKAPPDKAFSRFVVCLTATFLAATLYAFTHGDAPAPTQSINSNQTPQAETLSPCK